MKFLDLFQSTDNIQLDKKTLVTLRWIAIGGQLFTINFVYFILQFSLPVYYCFLVSKSDNNVAILLIALYPSFPVNVLAFLVFTKRA